MTAVCTNNNISPSFLQARGMRHGCPLPPLFFAFTIELLTIALRSNKDVKGSIPYFDPLSSLPVVLLKL